MKKKILVVIAAVLMCIGILAGCGGEKNITVITREEGSGTRSAFEELLGVTSGNIYSDLTFNNTNGVMTEVSNNKNAIGYISLGSLNDTVKAAKINGVVANAENVINQTYPIARPFEFLTSKSITLSAAAQDFLDYCVSSAAQGVIRAKGYVSISDGTAYTAKSDTNGKISVSGSTSVQPLAEALFAEYHKLNPNVTLQMTASGSGQGIKDATDGTADIGMSSRELKAAERENLSVVNLCKDGIAVIVNKTNTIENLSMEQLKQIYTGEVRKFSLI